MCGRHPASFLQRHTEKARKKSYVKNDFFLAFGFGHKDLHVPVLAHKPIRALDEYVVSQRAMVYRACW